MAQAHPHRHAVWGGLEDSPPQEPTHATLPEGLDHLPDLHCYLCLLCLLPHRTHSGSTKPCLCISGRFFQTCSYDKVTTALLSLLHHTGVESQTLTGSEAFEASFWAVFYSIVWGICPNLPKKEPCSLCYLSAFASQLLFCLL